MTQTKSERFRWTTANLEDLPNKGNLCEIIDGELIVNTTPHWRHQDIAVNICAELKVWCRQTGLGEATVSPRVIFADGDNVRPDVVWVSQERFKTILDEAGRLTDASELVVEVLSAGKDNQRRDKEVKLKLYSMRGFKEYWICDRFQQTIEIYRRENAVLKLSATLFNNDVLTSPLLPGFTCQVARIFA